MKKEKATYQELELEITRLRKENENLKHASNKGKTLEFQSLLKTILENVKDILILAVDKNYNFLYFNSAFKLTLKNTYNIDLELGDNSLNFLSNDDRSRIKNNYDKAFSGISHSSVQVYNENHPSYFESFYDPIFNEMDEIIGVIVFSHDISARKQLEEKLGKSEARYKQLFENLNESFIHAKIIVDRDGEPVDWEFIDANLAFANQLKLEKSSIIGHKASEIFLKTAHDQNNIFQLFGKTALTGEEQSIQDYVGPSGRIFVLHIFSPATGEFAATFTDISQFKYAEEELSKANHRLELANVLSQTAFWEIDFNADKMITKNNIWDEIYGLENENISSQWGNNIHPDDLEKTWKSVQDHFEGKTDKYLHEFRYKNPKTGSEKWINDIGKVVEFNKDGSPSKILGISIDITRRKKIEAELIAEKERAEENERNLKVKNVEYEAINDELRKANEDLYLAKEKAEESESLKTAFLNNMSHEIRTPMNAIVGFSNMLDNPDITYEKRKSFISIINNNTNQLLSIVTNILTISSLETHQEKLKIKAIVINDIIVELLSIFKIQASKKNIKLFAKQQLTDKQSDIYSDKTKITQILTNLLSNALKFTHRGTIEFGYNLKDNNIEFYVKDTGIGIPTEMQEKIFLRFRQADLTINQRYGGTGLGLTISRELALLLGGEIWVESEPDKGSIFYFTVPYSPVNEIVIGDGLMEQPVDKTTILVAEDEEYNFLFIEELLINMNFNLIHTKDGRETLDLCKTNPHINLILMDIKMPLMDGYTAAKEIKKFRPDISIIAQSAYALEHEKEKFAGTAFDEYVTKPINEDELKQKVMKCITKKSFS